MTTRVDPKLVKAKLKKQAIESAKRALVHDRPKGEADIDFANGAEVFEHVQDLLTNVRLLMDSMDLDIYDCLVRSYNHYLEER